MGGGVSSDKVPPLFGLLAELIPRDMFCGIELPLGHKVHYFLRGMASGF